MKFAWSMLLPLAVLCGCAGSRAEVVDRRAASPPPSPAASPAASPAVPSAATAVVFCADGAGGFGGTTDALRDSLGGGSAVRVERVDWSHGRGRMLADHLDHGNIVTQGRRLARRIEQVRAGRPDLPVYVVGHSAGCAVVLVAAESAGPGCIERAVLLAPSVSSGYDLRPALAHCRVGIDAFVSKADWWVLGLGMRFSGTTDRRWDYTAGRVGFRAAGSEPRDRALYAKLRQHPWDPSQAKVGHHGGHYGSFEDGFLRAYVLPLLAPAK